MGYINAPNFDPILIDLPGPMGVSWYGMMYLAGFVFAYLFVAFHIRTKRIRLDSDQLVNILVLIFLGVLIGGRLGFCLFVNPSYYLRHPLEILAVWQGGMYFFGGLILAMVLPYFYIRRIGFNYFDFADLIIIPAPMALAFGRWGNFINGEFWGRPSTEPWAMVFDTVPREKWFSTGREWVQEFMTEAGMQIPAAQTMVNLPRHPVQLYELVLEGIILFLILLLFRNIGKAKPRGAVFSLFLLLYGLMRFWIEFYREPVSHSAIIAGDWFTLSMLFSLPMVLAGAAGLYLAYSRRQPNLLYTAEAARENETQHKRPHRARKSGNKRQNKRRSR
jgi:phosphatidylglycerol:prolipoprotein diacylglycerol transferase